MDSLVSLLIVAVAIFTCIPGKVSSVEVGTGGDEGGGNSLLSTTSQNVLLSLSVLCMLVLVVFGCTWVWWRRVLCFWRKSGTHEAPPDWFVPDGGPTFTTLDPSNLPRDTGRGGRESITIDALPTLHELGLDGRDSFELRTFKAPSITAARSWSLDEQPVFDISYWFQPNQISFPRTNLEYQQIIGKGWFGKVLEAEAINIKQYVRTANVIVRELRNNATDKDQVRFLSEARVFREANEQRCEHVLKLLGFCVEQMPYILIFEYFPLGDLKSYLKTQAKKTPGQLKAGEDGLLTRMVIDIIRGVKWMENAGFVHGDLAARNCLVATSAGKVVIGDYGSSLQKYKTDYFWSSDSGCAVPIRWAAPETLVIEDGVAENDEAGPSSAPIVVRPLETTPAANIWSLGVVIWEVFQLGKTPYDNLTNDDVIRRVIKQKSFILEPPQLPFVKDTTKDKIYRLLVTCWNSTPSHRPSIDAIEQLFTTPS